MPVFNNLYGISAEPKTVGELIEFLQQFPSDIKVTYDFGNGLDVEFLLSTDTLDFHCF